MLEKLKVLILTFAVSLIPAIAAYGSTHSYAGNNFDVSSSRVRTVSCESHNYRYNSCYVGRHVESVELARQHSESACNQGSSWGFDGDSIWVNAGCRATFRVYERRRGGDSSIVCESNNYRYNVCSVRGEISDAYLAQQLSNASCREGDSWGITSNGRGIWVDRGCRGRFQVRYY